MRGSVGNSLLFGALALAFGACSLSHGGPPDGSSDGGSDGRVDSSVFDGGRDSGRDTSTDGDVGVGPECGPDTCAAGEVCCAICGGPPFFCSPEATGCPIPVCPPPPPECMTSDDCGRRGVCDYPDGTCGGPGTCTPRPDGCDDEYCPVIGCDGAEYSNACEALSAGVDFALPCSRGMPVGRYVMDFVEVAQANPTGDPSIVAGMNLDGIVSRSSDPEACFHTDFTSPPPDSEAGVDNQLGPILSSVGASVSIDFAPSIASGALLILLDVRDTGGAHEIDVHVGATADGARPRLRSSGRLRAGQRFTIMRTLGRLSGRYRRGRTRAGPGGLSFPIHPMAPTGLPMNPAYLYGTVSADGVVRGVVGGSLSVEDVISAVVALDPGAIPPDLARAVLEAQADLSPGPSGECTRLSAGWRFTAIPASF